MEKHREKIEVAGDCREPTDEAGKGLDLSSKDETLGCELDVPQKDPRNSNSGVCDVGKTDENPNDGGSATGNHGDLKAEDGKTGEEETVISAGNEVTDENSKCEIAAKSDAEQKVKTGKSSQKSSVVDETFSVAEDKDEQEKEEDNDMDVDSKDTKEENVGLNEHRYETTDAKHSEAAQVQEEPTELSKGETGKGNPGTVSSAAEICLEEEETNVNQEEENREDIEIDCVDQGQVEKNVKVGGALVNAGNESAGAEADGKDHNVDMVTDLTGTIGSADSEKPVSPSEDAATGEVEPLDHNALFDPGSDITNFIDFSGVSWSGNIQDIKTNVGNVSNKAGGATDKDHNWLDRKALDQQDAIREEEDDSTPEAPNQKEDTEMEENPNNSDDGTDSDIKTKDVKRKADVLSEDSLGEGRKTVSFAERPPFKIGACIARAASQMAGSPSVLKGNNFGDETLAVESFISQLHCAARDPAKKNIVSEIAAGFFLDFRNSSVSQQAPPEKVSRKRGRPANPTAGGTEAFEFEEMGDTYWTDRVVHKEQTEKGNYPAELKPPQVRRTRRPYRRRQSQISTPLPSASGKPAEFDENAPAELVMNFSETDTIPPEKTLSRMFRHFGPIKESQTEVDKENNRARVVFRKGTDAEVAYNSAGRFNIFGNKTVNYELSCTITETFKVQPYVVSLTEEETVLSLPS